MPWFWKHWWQWLLTYCPRERPGLRVCCSEYVPSLIGKALRYQPTGRTNRRRNGGSWEGCWEGQPAEQVTGQDKPAEHWALAAHWLQRALWCENSFILVLGPILLKLVSGSFRTIARSRNCTLSADGPSSRMHACSELSSLHPGLLEPSWKRPCGFRSLSLIGTKNSWNEKAEWKGWNQFWVE